MAPTSLGEFLRARRASVTPDDLGLPTSRARRVSGLRREEIAMLAGVSVDYYIRLEQGRERNPSTQVLDALGTVLRLDEDGRTHLFRLAGLLPRARGQASPERADPHLRELMDTWPDNPAVVLGRALDVLASNQLADALFGGFGRFDNLMFNMFFDPVARSFYTDWHRVAANSVAGLRLAEGAAPDDPRLLQVVRELDERSPEFREMWANNDARGKRLEVKTFVHHEVGPITLSMHSFDVRAAAGQQLVVYHAEAGSSSAQALKLLGSIAATKAQASTG
jgi:transcriptional regulator with XRE-family HTH domain